MGAMALRQWPWHAKLSCKNGPLAPPTKLSKAAMPGPLVHSFCFSECFGIFQISKKYKQGSNWFNSSELKEDSICKT